MLSRFLVFVLCLQACSPMAYTHGVPNLAQVDPSIYRSGEPTADGWDYIATLAAGRKIHVIKLNFIAEGNDAVALERGYDVLYVPIQPEGDQNVFDDVASVFKGPDEANVGRAVETLATCLHHPDTDFCLVHCTHGQDRTGYVVGKHRVLNDGWPKSRAWHEMLDHHFHWELVGLVDAWEDFHP